MITKHFVIKFVKKILKHNENIDWNIVNTILTTNSYLDQYLPVLYNKIKGDLFEIITKFMLINMGYKYCYLYNEIPKRLKRELNLPNNDRGIDIICSKNNNKYIGVQCKWRSKTNKSIKKCYVTEFLHEMNQSKLEYGIMISNVKYITPTFNNMPNLK